MALSRFPGFVGWITAVVVSAAGFAVAPHAVVDRVPVVAEVEEAFATTPPRGVPGLDSLVATAVFRADRLPPARRYAPGVDPDERRDEVLVQAPPWRLTGVVGGADPVALLEGVESMADAPRLVSVGEDVDGYRIEVIHADSVVVTLGADRWTLFVEVPWGR